MGDARDTSKAPDAFRTISEVAEDLDLPQHVLRFWETRFTHIRPVKRGGGRRFYRPEDIDLLRGIRHLLYSDGYTIKGVQKILKEQGVRHVQDLGVEHDVAVMRSARERSPQDGVTFGGLLGLLPRRKPRPAEAHPEMDELPLPFPDPEADRETGRDAPPLDVPLRRRPTGHAPAARSPDEERDAAEPRLDPSFAPPRGRGGPRRPPEARAEARQPDLEERGGPLPAAAPPRQRPTRGPAARIAPEHDAQAAPGSFDDPLLPFFDDAPPAPAAFSEPLDARIRRLKGDIAAEAEGRRDHPRLEEGPPRERRLRSAPEAPHDAAADPHGRAARQRPPPADPDMGLARHPAPEPTGAPPSAPRHGRLSWDELDADDGAFRDDPARDRSPRRPEARMRADARRPRGEWGEDQDGDGFAPPVTEGRGWAPEAEADDPFAPPRRPERGAEPYRPHEWPPEDMRPEARREAARRPPARADLSADHRPQSRAEPWSRPFGKDQRDQEWDQRGPADPRHGLGVPDDVRGSWAEPVPEGPPRRTVPRFGPFAGPAEEIAPPGPELLPHAETTYAGPAETRGDFDREIPPAPRSRRAVEWHGHDPFEAEGPRRPAPPEPLRHGPPEQYLPPHLRSEPRIAGQPPGAAPVLSRADVHRLQAALYELTECRRLMGDATGRERRAGPGESAQAIEN
ncbi:DNA-binding transcriptional MerR regulator [Xanthobacter tagetidis]|nr:DNA-binding transcriptional MerR regulator [Xanthobacter tagetidis]